MLTPVGCAGGYKWHMHDKGVLWMGQEDDIGFADWRFEGMAVWRYKIRVHRYEIPCRNSWYGFCWYMIISMNDSYFHLVTRSNPPMREVHVYTMRSRNVRNAEGCRYFWKEQDEGRRIPLLAAASLRDANLFVSPQDGLHND